MNQIEWQRKVILEEYTEHLALQKKEVHPKEKNSIKENK
jgi:hypothetical protein